jgi:hypothetical protein
MKKSEFFAASQFLTDWPDGMSFSDLLSAIADGSEEITPWEMVEDWSDADLAEAIEMCEKAFSRAVADILNEEKNPQPEKHLSPYFGDVQKFLQDHLTIIKVKG